MSVRNITNIPMARNTLTATAKSVRERAEAAKAASLELDKVETDVKIGAAAVLQSIADDREPLIEEIGQIQGILDSVRSAATAVATPEPEPVPTPAPVPVPAPPAPTPEPEPVPAPAPVPVPAPPAPTPEPASRSQFNPREWNWSKYWWLIVLCTIIGIVFADRLGSWFAYDWYSRVGGVTMVILYVAHWVIWPMAGFFGGGWWSTALEERRTASN